MIFTFKNCNNLDDHHSTSLYFTSLHSISLHLTSLHLTSLHFTLLHFIEDGELGAAASTQTCVFLTIRFSKPHLRPGGADTRWTVSC